MFLIPSLLQRKTAKMFSPIRGTCCVGTVKSGYHCNKARFLHKLIPKSQFLVLWYLPTLPVPYIYLHPLSFGEKKTLNLIYQLLNSIQYCWPLFAFLWPSIHSMVTWKYLICLGPHISSLIILRQQTTYTVLRKWRQKGSR